ncbi:hydroxymethylglutaryl-CoA lyase [Lapillicoccus jejuensis]|uniref:Hydroxymethylglutaryl-CoA lyase n=1 Tax=Lapillicoccus jejuensis TaxID=402171 RepID=A0A542E5F3_9MICO|nr:hydroxymethylglutaryl-CoA lyase [Lapillicoccus jejuensis]TQJ10572.1 hydroxymethylglutaryl-CoA lyase [Lapillicoccus jejuensis]
MPASPVELVEVGPRDGLQNEARTLPVGTRVELITRLLALGVRRLEAVSFVRPDRVPQMAGAEEVMAQVPRRDDVTYIGLVLNRRGAERAALTACTEVNVVVPVTDAFAERNQGASTAALVEQAAGAVGVAREAGMSVTVTLAVAFGCPFTGAVPLERVREVTDRVLDLGLDELAFADTVGVGTPDQVAALAGLVRGDARVPALRWHFHNTRNTGYANAWAAATQRRDAGQRLALDASLGGFGGCPFAPAATGNIATEDLAYLLRHGGVAASGPERLDLAAADASARWLAEQVGTPVTAQLGRAGDAPDPVERAVRA